MNVTLCAVGPGKDQVTSPLTAIFTKSGVNVELPPLAVTAAASARAVTSIVAAAVCVVVPDVKDARTLDAPADCAIT